MRRNLIDRNIALARKRHKSLICISLLLLCLVIQYIRNSFQLINFPLIGGKMRATYIDEDGICVNALPYAQMHHPDPNEIKRYQKAHIVRANLYFGKELKFYGEMEPPSLRTLPPGSSFAFWDCQDRKKDCEIQIDHFNIKGSAWTADGKQAFVDERRDENRMKLWVSHDRYEFLATKRTTIKGDSVAMFGFYADNFGHVLHDNFPLLAWLKETQPKYSTFILPGTKRYRQLIDFIDPQFSERIYFYEKNEVVTVEEGTLTVAYAGHKFLAHYGNTLFRYFRHWIFQNHPETYPDDEKYLIFHTRGGKYTTHGRVLDTEHEKDVLALIQHNMEKYNRKEKIVFFTGMDSDGNILPYSEQYDIFRHASTIIGPHGSGLANIVWTQPFPKSCGDRVHFLEFIAGSDGMQVQSPMFNGYYWVLRGMPIDWHQITYAGNSTLETTYLRLNDVQVALDAMWG